ncbi:MAG: hypothetical protein KBB01_04650 [Candidatus Omnitrophica bacterium]|jgi:hypothetical protein|nr:hypothetical protein [Candidatus Omnitrophota bacterium]
MRRYFLVFLLLVFYSLAEEKAFCSYQDLIEVDLVNKEVKLVDFLLGNCKLNGSFTLALSQDSGSLTINLIGKNISIFSLDNKLLAKEEKLEFPWLKARFVKINNIIFIEEFSWPQFMVVGNINLDKGELALKVNGTWQANLQVFEGDAKIALDIWGKLGKFFTSGHLLANNGRYKKRRFSQFRLDFLGNPPIFNITDSEVIALDGSIFEIEGILDLRNFSNLIPGAKFSAQKIFIDEWQLFSAESQDIGLRKDLDNNFGVYLSANEEEEERTGANTELRYNLEDDKMLKFKVGRDQTLLQLERRKDF